MIISIIVNDEGYDLEVGEKELLIDTLREKLGLTGTKRGCNTVNCGACTVVIDGKAEKSCAVLSKKVHNKKIVTIEGLEQNGKLDPIQKAFIDAGAIQCGYCTPGMVMATKGLLDNNSNPTDDEIKEALKDNLCRCTGYFKIMKAVRLAIEYRGVLNE